MLVYDVTSRASFEALNGWLKEMRTHLDKPSDVDSIAFVVCANKVIRSDVVFLFLNFTFNRQI